VKLRLTASLAALLIASTALAVIPAGRTVLMRFASRQAVDHAAPSTLIGQLTLPGQATAFAARVDLAFPNSCKTQFELPSGRALVNLVSGALANQSGPQPAVEAFVAFACPLFALKNVPSSDADNVLGRLLTSWGISLEVSSMNMLNGHAAYVIGAKPNETTRPQIWFDKVTERPVRVIAARGGKLWDLRFTDPASVATNRLAPRVTQVWQDNALMLTLHLMAMDVKVSGPAASADESDDDSE
jgi:hypothetical protein